MHVLGGNTENTRGNRPEHRFKPHQEFTPDNAMIIVKVEPMGSVNIQWDVLKPCSDSAHDTRIPVAADHAIILPGSYNPPQCRCRPKEGRYRGTAGKWAVMHSQANR